MPTVGTLVTPQNFVAGAQVSRSKMWCWDNDDKGQPMTLVRLLSPNEAPVRGSSGDDGIAGLLRALMGNSGSPTSKDGDKEQQWVEVEIPSTKTKDKFRCGFQGAYDLVYGPTPEPPLKIVDPPNNLLGKPVTVDNFSPNARVSRGHDWRWGDQDTKGPGMLLRPDPKKKGWAVVRFGNGRDNSYRIQDEHGSTDLVYGSQPKPLVPIDAPSKLIGEHVTSSNVVEGARVTRGEGWSYGYQDRGKPGILLRLHDGGLWVRWSDDTENRYSPGGRDLVYGTVPKQEITLPLFKNKFSLADRWSGIDAHASGDVVATSSRNMSTYSNEIFEISTSDFEVFFEIRELHDGVAGLGIMKECASIERTARHIVGEVELDGSIGIGIEKGHGFILVDDKKRDVEKMNTTGSTLLGMKIKNGNVTFTIDNDKFETTPLTSSNLSGLSGMYRVVVSLSKEGQRALFFTKRNLPPGHPDADKQNFQKKSSSESDDDGQDEFGDEGWNYTPDKNKPETRRESEFPQIQWSSSKNNGKFTFFDWLRTIDVFGDDKRSLKCKSSKRGTVFSNEIFDIETANFEETIYFPGGTLGGNLSFGIVDANPTLHASSVLCGEVEIPHSLGLLLKNEEQVAILYKDKIRDSKPWPTNQDTTVVIRVRGGNVTFEVDNHPFSPDILTLLNKKAGSVSKSKYDPSDEDHLLVKGKFRLAVSFSFKGQKATFDRERGRTANGSAGPIPRAIWTKGTYFTFHDYFKSIDVIGNKRELVCKGIPAASLIGIKIRATCFSKQIFELKNAAFTEVVTFHGGLHGGEVCFGIVGATPGSLIGKHLCGEKEIPDSVGLFFREGRVAILHDDKIVDGEPLKGSASDDIVVRMVVSSGKMMFFVNGNQFQSPYLDLLASSPTLSTTAKCKGKFRLGISLSAPGQRATLTGGDVPHRQWTDGTPFTFHDLIKSINVIENGKAVECVESTRGTVYSNEVFDARSVSFVRTFTLHGGTRGGDVSFGLIDENPSLLVANHICGEVELHNSIGFLFRPGRAGILHRDNIKDAEAAETEDKDLTVTMTLNNGRLSFQLNDEDFSAPYLSNIGCDGTFRLAISLTRKGQRVSVSDPTIAMNLPEIIRRNPITSASTESSGERLRLQSISATASTSKSGIAVWATGDNRTTVFSHDVFDLSSCTMSLRVVVEGGLNDGDISIGFISSRAPPRAVATHLTGEVEIPNSFGCLLRPDRTCVLRSDKLIDVDSSMTHKNNNDITVRINLSNGRMFIMIDGRNFSTPTFSDSKLEGMARFSISVTKKDQKVYLGYDGVTSFRQASGGYDAAPVDNRVFVDNTKSKNGSGGGGDSDLQRLLLAALLRHAAGKDSSDDDDNDRKNRVEELSSSSSSSSKSSRSSSANNNKSKKNNPSTTPSGNNNGNSNSTGKTDKPDKPGFQFFQQNYGYPPECCFVRGVPKDLSLRDSVDALMSIRELPSETLDDGTKRILRPDLQDYIPTDDVTDRLMRKAERELPLIKDRPIVQELIKSCGLTDDDLRALLFYKVEQPYPLYLWLNAWLMGNRRDGKVKTTVGPIFTRIYNAMKKLPKVKCRASRAVTVKDIPALRATFDNYETRCAAGKPMCFWGLSSFSRNDAVGADQFAGDTADDAIIYSCPDLEGVDMEPFRPEGMPSEAEILPLCPSVFSITGSQKVISRKLVVLMKQLDHDEFSYV